MRTLDRYVIRECLPPFLLALAVFTFILAVRPMLDQAEQLLAKGVSVPTVGFLLLTLLPQSLGVTIPMAFLAGLLMALGRLSADHEGVAFLACGVSPLRLLRPILVFATVVGGLNMYVLIDAVPDANQKYREITYQLLQQQTANDIKPRVFYEGFPGKVLYYLDQRPDGTWSDVLLADTTQPGRPTIVLAEDGQLVLDREHRQVNVVLHSAIRYSPGPADLGTYDVAQTQEERFSVEPEAVFGSQNVQRGLTEMTIADLRSQIALKLKVGESPHNEIMHIHQKFAFPASCLVFAFLSLGLGLHTRKEGRLAGMVLGLGVVSIYYVLMVSAEAWTKGHFFPAAWARWLPNIVLGAAGVVAVWWRSRAAGQALRFPIPAWITRKLAPEEPDAPSPTRPAVTDRVVLVVRLPRLARIPFPRPRLLDVYVSGKYLRLCALAFFGLLALYYIGTFVDLSEKLFKGQATTGLLVRYLWYSTPQFISYVIPMAALIGVLGTIGGLTRTSELTVMRACGVSLYRVAVPLLLIAMAWSGLLFGLEEHVTAPANRKAEELSDLIHGRTGRPVMISNRNWLADRDGRIYYYVSYQSRQQELFSLSIFDTATNPYRLSGHTFASRAAAERSGSMWRATNGWVQRFTTPTKSVREGFTTRELHLASVTDFAAEPEDADSMTFAELRAYIGRLTASGFTVTDQRVNLHKKIAYPLVTLVMTVLGVPFAVSTGRRGALYGIGLAIAVAIGYWLISAVSLAMGAAGILPALLAAWAPNIVFLAAAMYLTLTVRT